MKVKVFPVSAMKVYREVAVKVDSFLILALDGGDWLASRLDHFSTGKEFLCPLDRRLCGPKSRSGRFGDQKNLLSLTRIQTPGRPARSLVSPSATSFRLLIASLGEFAKLRKVTLSFVMSFRLSSWNNSAPTGRILMEFDISVIFEICRELSTFH
jgi:hypothetical protein